MTPGSVAALAAALLLSAPAARPQQTPSFSASRELVRIDVVVVDDAGVPVRGLTAADFEIVEKGRRVPITSFEAVVPAPAAPETGAAAAADADEATAPRPAEPEHNRAFLILFDDVSLGHGASSRVRRGLTDLLRGDLRDGDLVSLHTTSGLRFTARTASERQQMGQIVSTLVGTRWTDLPDLDLRGVEEVGVAQFGSNEPAEFRTLSAHLDRQRASAGLSAMAQALVALEGFRGRKSLIVYSEGYKRYAEMPQYDQVIELARRTRVSIYFSDAFGLQGDGTRAEGRLPGEADAPHRHRLGWLGNGEGPAYVAEGTGGRAATTNDQTLLFREAATLASAYYLLGFEPPEGKPGGRQIDVKVRKGLKVVGSDRYFVSPPAGPSDTASALRGAMVSMFDSGDVPFTVSTGSRQGVSSTTFVVSLAREADAPPRKLDLRIEARPLAGGETVRDASELTVPRGSGPARLRRELPLRPGPWQAKVAVRDRDTGRIGSLLHTFEVTDAAAGAP